MIIQLKGERGGRTGDDHDRIKHISRGEADSLVTFASSKEKKSGTFMDWKRERRLGKFSGKVAADGVGRFFSNVRARTRPRCPKYFVSFIKRRWERLDVWSPAEALDSSTTTTAVSRGPLTSSLSSLLLLLLCSHFRPGSNFRFACSRSFVFDCACQSPRVGLV